MVWYLCNFTISTVLLCGFLVAYAYAMLGKARKGFSVGIVLASVSLFLGFALISWVVTGDLSALQQRRLPLCYMGIQIVLFLLFYLLGYPQEKISVRLVCAACFGIVFFVGDALAALLLQGIDYFAGTQLWAVVTSADKYFHWWGVFVVLPDYLALAALLPLVKRIYPRLHGILHSVRLFSLLLFPLTQFFVIYALVRILQYFDAVHTSFTMMVLLVITILLSVLSNVLLLFFLRKMHAKEQENQNLQFYEEYETLSKRYQEQAVRAFKDIAKLRHDFHNQMAVFSELMQSDAIADAMQLAQELQVKLENQKLKLQYCENTIANVILQQTADTCAMHGIAFETRCVLREHVGIRKVDLCSLLLNPLQNAIRAQEDVPERERDISCRIREEGDMVFIGVRNRKNQAITKKDGKLQTTKSDRENHGFGISIMEYIAKSYGGTVAITYDDCFFDVLIQLNLPETSEEVSALAREEAGA